MITCFDCHRPITTSEARMSRHCHRVIYLCPECHATVRNNMAMGRLKGTLLTQERPGGQNSVSLQF